MKKGLLFILTLLIFQTSSIANLAFVSDDCATATDLNALFGGGLDNTISSALFDNTAATVSGTEPATGYECWFDGPILNNTQWYTFVGDGLTYSIGTSECAATNYITDGDTQIAIYSGADCGSLTPVACNDDSNIEPDIYAALTSLETENGTTYYIMIDGYDGLVGEYCIQVTEVNINAAGDECADATDLGTLFGSDIGVVNDSPIFDNTVATASGMDPATGYECFAEGPPSLENTQWFTFVGDGNVYQIESSDCGAPNYLEFGDTQFALYSGDDCGNLTAVACNDDIDLAGNNYASRITVETEDGVTYYLMVDGYDGTVGQYCLQVSQVSLITCLDIAVGTPTATATNLCFEEMSTLSLTGSTVVPPIGPLDAFMWGVSSMDASGSTDPFNGTGFLGGFGLNAGAVDVTFTNNMNLGLPAGSYYFTPIVFGGAVDTDGTLAGLDFSNGCALAGTSILVTLYEDFADMAGTSASEDEITPPGNNGEASVSVTGGSGNYTYLWANGETTDTITGLAAGTYSVTVSDQTGCVEDIVLDVTVDMITGIAELAFNQAIEMFPNPASNQVNIKYDFDEIQDLEVAITNTLGQVMTRRLLSNAQVGFLDIDLGTFADGVYFVTLSNGDQQVVRRLMVNK